jgi:hypothetical protein
MDRIRFVIAIGIAVSSGVGIVNAQDHGHLNAGAESQTPGSKLIFANGADFATNSLYVKTLTFTNATKYAGFYQGNTTLTVLPATSDYAGPDPAAPALGSYIFAQLVSLEGPAGGEFGFWEAPATSPSYTIKCGESGGTNVWRLTEADGSPGIDPYGHIHGRRWTLTKPGLYVLGLRLLDLSTNGPDGGPIHTPSDVIYTYVQADVNIVGVEAIADHARVRFTTPLGTDWQLEASDSLSGTATWTPLGDPVTGTDVIRELPDAAPAAPNRFYRLRGIVP